MTIELIGEEPLTKDGLSPGYLDLDGRQIYRVLHVPQKIAGAVLVCGPTCAERERAHHALNQWCRTLSNMGLAALRFDYAGTGESSGEFSAANFSRWIEDAEGCLAWLHQRIGGVPILLHGVRAGALIAAELFSRALGDGLLLWATPKSAEALLWDTMRRTLAAQMVNDPHVPRQTREGLLASMEAGQSVNVDGYSWTRQFWDDAKSHVFKRPADPEMRPWLNVAVKRGGGISPISPLHEQSVGADALWEQSPFILPRVDQLFSASLDWIRAQADTLMDRDR